MVCTCISWFICIFVAVVVASNYNGTGSITEADAEGTTHRLKSDNKELSGQKVQGMDLGALLDAGESAVVTLVAGDTRLVAHRAVLAARSPVFAAMFRNSTLMSSSSQVTISDVEGPVLRHLLAYLYTLQAPELPSMAPQLLAVADNYGLSVLKAQCEQQVATQLSVETAAATGVLAIRHSSDSLMEATVTFIKAHLLHVMATRGWSDAIVNHPDSVVELTRLIAGTIAENSSPASEVGATAPATRPQRDRGGDSPVSPTAACPTHPPEDACVSCMQRLSREEKSRRLIEVAKEGAVEDLQILLSAGADVEARDEGGETALHWAAKEGHVEVVRRLAEARAQVDARSIKQNTPLHFAAREGHTEVVQLLVESGAQVDARNMYQSTPLLLAAQYGNPAVARVLVAASAYHSARNQYGWTPLHYAADNDHAGVVSVLLEAGADKAARTNDGKTPLDLARLSNLQQIIDILG